MDALKAEAIVARHKTLPKTLLKHLSGLRYMT